MSHQPEVHTMRRIDIRELPEQTDEELGTGEAYRVERDGRTIGYLIPVHRVDPEESKRAFEAFNQMIERLRQGGWSQADIEDVFDLTRPDPLLR